MTKYISFFLISIMLVMSACGGNSSGSDPSTYTITYNSNGSTGGVVPLETASFTSGQTVTVQGNPGNLVKNGFSFTGWNTVADGSGSLFTQGGTFIVGKDNVTLFAQWTSTPSYTVTYDGNGNTGGVVPSDTTSYKPGVEVTVSGNTGNLVRTGFSFTGWNTADDGSGTGYTQNEKLSMGSSNLVLFARWSSNPVFAVTYDGNGNTGGTVPSDTTNYEQNSTAIALANTGNLVKAGFIFVKWNTVSDGSGTGYFPGNTISIGSSNVTLYAVWVQTFAVKYFNNGSDSGEVPVDSNRYKQGDTVTVSGNTGSLAKSGFTFLGWAASPDSSGSTYNQNQQFVIGSGDVNLYARWTLIPTFKVIFNGNGSTGGDVPVDTSNYQQGATVTVPGNAGNLVKSGYSFTGWNAKADGNGAGYTQGNAFSIGSSDITLYAQWSADPVYNVIYNGNGSENVSVPVDSTGYLRGETVTVSGNIDGLVKSGYTFTGWNTQADGRGAGFTQSDTFIIGNSNVVLYAQWSGNPTFTLTYDGNGNAAGSVPIDSVNYEQFQNVTAAGNTGNLAKDHHMFAGWNTRADGSGSMYHQGDTFNMGNSNVVLYAQWAAAFAVIYSGNGNTGGNVPSDSNNYSPGQTAFVLSNTGSLIKTGNSFNGWNSAADGTGVSYTSGTTLVMGASDITLYAQWTTLTVYAVTYDGNGSTEGAVPSDTTGYLDGQSFTILGNTGGLAKSGSFFTGWNTAANGSGTNYTQGLTGDIAAANVILFAQWTTNPTYSVVYNGNGGNSGLVPVDTTNFISGQTVTVFDNSGNLSKTGFAFAGWNTSSNGLGTSYMSGSTFSIGSSNVTLYAQWDAACSIIYKGNGNTGGSAPVDAVSYVYGSSAVVLGNINLVKAGYTFNGWTTAPDGSGTVYSQGANILVGSSDVVLYSKWTSLPVFKVTYNGNGNTGGTVPVDTTNYVSGQSAVVLANSGTLVKSMNTFAGWNTSANGSGITYTPNLTMTVNGNVTLYAKWVASKPWYSIIGTSDGSKLAAAVYNEYLYTMNETDNSWTTSYNSPKKWYSITGSADGTKLAAVVSGGQIYVSSDSGKTWTAKSTSKSWRSIASSSDGAKLAAVVSNGQIYISADSGTTWTARDSSRSWRSITSSSDGTRLAAVVRNGLIYTSVNSGLTWTATASSRYWYGITSSGDGTKLAAVVSNGQIWTSADSGATWTAHGLTKTWRAIAGSGDGTKLVAVVNGGQIYTSTDSGLTWTARAISQAWYSVTSSSDGTKLAAAVYNGAIYTSTDSGVTWVAK